MNRIKRILTGGIVPPNDEIIHFSVSKRHKDRLLAQYDEWCVKNGYFNNDTKPSFSMWLAFEKLKLIPETEETRFEEISAADRRGIFKMVREFLMVIADTKEIKKVPKELRIQARKILDFFPNDSQVNNLIPNEIESDDKK